MLRFTGSWDAQADGFERGPCFAAESGFAFEVDEPGSRRRNQSSSLQVITIGPRYLRVAILSWIQMKEH